MSLQFRISGRVVERESGNGIGGLMVRAYDKDLLFDDLLGSATTGADGKFELFYREADFRELFERCPDVYLSLYERPGKFLLHTKDAIRWNAGKDETFDLVIDREKLDPRPSQGRVGNSLNLPATALKIETRGGFAVPKIRGFATGGRPGAPAVPRQMRYVVLPHGANVRNLEVRAGEPIRVEANGIPLPAHGPIPDIGLDPRTGEPLGNSPGMTQPDPRFYGGSTRYPETLAEVIRVEGMGPLQVAMIEVRPVQFDAESRSYFFYPDLAFDIDYDGTSTPTGGSLPPMGEYYLEDLESVLDSDVVVAAPDIDWTSVIMEETPHLILTDNFQWPESIAVPGGGTRPPNLSERGIILSGDLIGEFQRLADHRIQRGMHSMVVTISDIVDGRYGDFTQNGFARDLQELIRNFVKFAVKEWGTRYLVLGGDVEVVPMRKLVGSSTFELFGVERTQSNPPEKGRCCVVSNNVVKLRPKFVPQQSEPLCTHKGGVAVPFNPNASATIRGWYYVKETDFINPNKNSGFSPAPFPSQFIVVEGPKDIIDDDYYWVRENENDIPSDFYYASLFGPGYDVPGKHDFDHAGNDLYGKTYREGEKEFSLDDIDVAPDVWVGRVPANGGVHGRAYVDKVITYEELETPNSDKVESSYLRKIIYAADYWYRFNHHRQNEVTKAPALGTYTHVDGSNESHMKLHEKQELDMKFGVPSHRLIARTGVTETEIPFDPAAGPTGAGWFFTTDATFSTESTSATKFVKIAGPETSIVPDHFYWDPLQIEAAIQEKETLREMMKTSYPAFDDVERHYADHFEVTAPPPVVPLETPTLRAALDAGAHFVSLTGHGNPSGCCGVDAHAQPDFKNDRKYFIAFANSCLTSRPDGGDSLGEISVVDPDGGAVAYVGNTRYGWMGTGSKFEQFFWCALEKYGRVGPAAGLGVGTDNVSSFWIKYAQTLYGDPALSVWDHVPSDLDVTHPGELEVEFPVTIDLSDGDQPLWARVTLSGDGVFLTKRTGPQGRVTFSIPPNTRELLLTVTSRKGKVYRKRVCRRS